MTRARTLAALTFSVALAACAGHVEPPLRAGDVPSSWNAPVPGDAALWPDPQWWSAFQSPELSMLIDQAKTNNLDLAAAAARILQSQGQAKVAGAPLLPQLDLEAGLSKRDTFTNDATPNANGRNSFDLAAAASYELDVWGKNRANAKAARLNLAASQYDRETVAITVTANVAATYFQVLSLSDRLAIAHANLKNVENVLTLVQAKVNAGVATPLDLAQQRSALARQQATIPPLEQQQREALATLALLLGSPPQGFQIDGKSLKSVATPRVVVGLPSQLLTRRPDIANAEASLESADSSVVAARAAFYPSISLTGSTGFSSTALAALINPAAAAYNVGASLAQPLFDGRTLTGQLESAKGREQEVLANYRATVLNAFSEVGNTLGSVDALRRQKALQDEDVRQSQLAFNIAQARYRAGLEEFITVLDAQRTLYSAQDSQAQTELAQLQALVTLYRALGGGWEKGSSSPH